MILYVNSCVRGASRTDRIAKELLRRMGGAYEEVRLPDEGLQPLSEVTLSRRTALIERGAYDDPMFRYAKQFASADTIVISAPFWDLSFPALLKIYVENIYITGIVSEYDDTGHPHGLCRAKELIYVTTAGGPLVTDYGYEYLKTLATDYFGIETVSLVKAEMLDIVGADVEGILAQTMRDMKA